MTADERGARLAAIRARWAAVSHPGPWDAGPPDEDGGIWVESLTDGGYPICGVDADRPNDAEAIAHAPQDVAWLIAELERVTAELQRCRVEIEDMAEALGLPEDDREPPPLGD